MSDSGIATVYYNDNIKVSSGSQQYFPTIYRMRQYQIKNINLNLCPKVHQPQSLRQPVHQTRQAGQPQSQ